MTDSVVAFLMGQQLFSRMRRRQMRDVVRLSTPVTLKPGRVFCREGDIGREAFLILSGQALATRSGRPIAVVGPGEFVGEIALRRAGVPRTASVVALTTISALVFDSREFANLLHMHPLIASRIDDTIKGRLAHHLEEAPEDAVAPAASV